MTTTAAFLPRLPHEEIAIPEGGAKSLPNLSSRGVSRSRVPPNDCRVSASTTTTTTTTASATRPHSHPHHLPRLAITPILIGARGGVGGGATPPPRRRRAMMLVRGGIILDQVNCGVLVIVVIVIVIIILILILIIRSCSRWIVTGDGSGKTSSRNGGRSTTSRGTIRGGRPIPTERPSSPERTCRVPDRSPRGRPRRRRRRHRNGIRPSLSAHRQTTARSTSRGRRWRSTSPRPSRRSRANIRVRGRRWRLIMIDPPSPHRPHAPPRRRRVGGGR
jgi:hypothetical protein